MGIVNLPIVVDLIVESNTVAPTLIVEGNSPGITLDLDSKINAEIIVQDEYEGPYEVIPLIFEDETLATKDKYMTDDLVIKKVPNIDDYLNKIDSISVNGITQTIDQNKNVDIDLTLLDCGTSIINV